MSNILPFLLMTPIQAAHFREQTLAAQHRLDPVLVRGGPFKDRYVLPTRVMNDPQHADKLVGLTLLTEVVVDVDVAFPPDPG
jgi:hypothetical protein